MLPNAFSLIRSLLFSIPLIFLSTIIMAALGAAGSLLGGRRGFQALCMRVWAWMILRASLVSVRTTGKEKIPRTQPCLFCCNHLSYLDPPLLIHCLGGHVRFIAKKSLFAIPFLGWGMSIAGNIPLDRNNPRSALRSLKQAAGEIRGGQSFIIFPEGGRSPDGKPQPFLSGAFRLAIESQAPVIPVAVRGTRAVLRPGSINIRGGRVAVKIGDAIPTSGLAVKDRNALAASVRSAIEQMLAEG